MYWLTHSKVQKDKKLKVKTQRHYKQEECWNYIMGHNLPFGELWMVDVWIHNHIFFIHNSSRDELWPIM